MRAQRVGAETMLAQMIQLVAEAQRSRAPIQHLADRVAGYFVPAVLLCSLAAFVSWLTLGPSPALAYAVVSAISVLIIACPCALGLATPMSIMVGVGRGAREGVLIRNAAAIERTEKVTYLLTDKTGNPDRGPAPGHVLPTGGRVGAPQRSCRPPRPWSRAQRASPGPRHCGQRAGTRRGPGKR